MAEKRKICPICGNDPEQSGVCIHCGADLENSIQWKQPKKRIEGQGIIKEYMKRVVDHLEEAIKLFPSKHLLDNEKEWLRQIEIQRLWAEKRNKEWLINIKTKNGLSEEEFERLKEKCIIAVLTKKNKHKINKQGLIVIVIIITILTLWIGRNIISDTVDKEKSMFKETIATIEWTSEQKIIEENGFLIKFPSKPRKFIAQANLEDQSLGIDIISYQSDDGTGLYTISLGTLQKSLISEKIKKGFIQNLFESLASTTPGTKIHTQEQSNEDPYELSYLYTSQMHNLDWIHMGMIFLKSDSEYIKITLIYPVNQMEMAERNYTKFLNSFEFRQ